MQAPMAPMPFFASGNDALPYIDPAFMQHHFSSMIAAHGSPFGEYVQPVIAVSVSGMKFQYQLTEDDLRKVFDRYGTVRHVSIDDAGSSARLTLQSTLECSMAINDLHGKPLNGLEGTLCVTWGPSVASSLPAQFPRPAFPGMTFHGAYPVNHTPALHVASLSQTPGAQTSSASPAVVGSKEKVRKYTCKFDIQIVSCKEFNVGRRIIGRGGQNMQRIVKQTGVKLRLRGQGSGYLEPPDNKEAPEPMHLSLSSTNLRVASAGNQTNNYNGYSKAKSMVEQLLRDIYDDYRKFCHEKSRPVPQLEVQCREAALSGVPGGQAAPPHADHELTCNQGRSCGEQNRKSQ